MTKMISKMNLLSIYYLIIILVVVLEAEPYA